MIRMIIADDEFIVRDGLKNIVPWNEFGIEVIAEAEDGQEAYELCSRLKPEILLTDIRMPIMDGLEVAFKLKEEKIETRIVIISGIQDFNYAKAALNVNAEGYILKPVRIDELISVIRKVIDDITIDQKSNEKLLVLKKQLHENVYIMREKFLNNLISNIYMKEKDILEKFEYFSIPFHRDDKLMVAVLQIDDYENAIHNFKEENKQLLTFAVSNITEEIISKYNAGICFSRSENELVLIFIQEVHLNEKYMEICDEIISCLNKFLKVSVSIGVGQTVNNIKYISLSYRDAVTALQYKFYTGKGSVLNIKDIKSDNNVEIPDLYEHENQLMSSLKLGDSKAVEKSLNDIFYYFTSNTSLPVDYVQSVCVELVCVAFRNIYELGENMDNIVDNRTVILDTVYKTENVFMLKDYIVSIFIQTADYFSKKYNKKNSKVIGKIKEIISQKYRENIGVANIAEEIYLSPNYISLIFKQETGETITEYITKVRMEKAKELLKESELKILEVAESVGFENPQYFSTVFKKYTGMHPQKYRTYTSN